MRKRSLLLAAGVCMATLTLTIGTAMADPNGTPTFRQLAGVGAETTQGVMNALSDKVSNGCIGRQLPRLFRRAGLRDVEVEPATVIFPPLPFMTGLLSAMLADSPDIIDPADLPGWLAPLQEAEQAGHVFACFGGFTVSGTR